MPLPRDVLVPNNNQNCVLGSEASVPHVEPFSVLTQ